MTDYRVLVVDDQRDIRRLLTTALKSMGPALDVMGVPSAEEAVLVTSRRPVNLLVTDLALPGISGLELVKKFRVRFPTIKIIMITGLTDSRTRRQIEAAEIDAFYYKPVEMTDFLAAVERLLGMTVAPVEARPPGELEAVGEKPADEAAAQVVSTQQRRLDALREQFKASAVILVDEQGKSLAQSGDASSLAALQPALVNLGRSSQEAARQLGQLRPENLLLVAGQSQHLAVATAGERLLILAGDAAFRETLLGTGGQALVAAGAELERLGAVAETVAVPAAAAAAEKAEPEPAEAEAQLEALLLAKVEEVPQEDAEAALAEIDALFGKADQIKSTNLDDFWNNVAEGTESVKTNENVLTWDEARNLGLTPD